MTIVVKLTRSSQFETERARVLTGTDRVWDFRDPHWRKNSPIRSRFCVAEFTIGVVAPDRGLGSPRAYSPAATFLVLCRNWTLCIHGPSRPDRERCETPSAVSAAVAISRSFQRNEKPKIKSKRDVRRSNIMIDRHKSISFIHTRWRHL